MNIFFFHWNIFRFPGNIWIKKKLFNAAHLSPKTIQKRYGEGRWQTIRALQKRLSCVQPVHHWHHHPRYTGNNTEVQGWAQHMGVFWVQDQQQRTATVEVQLMHIVSHVNWNLYSITQNEGVFLYYSKYKGHTYYTHWSSFSLPLKLKASPFITLTEVPFSTTETKDVLCC